jgi:thymidylate kinase
LIEPHLILTHPVLYYLGYFIKRFLLYLQYRIIHTKNSERGTFVNHFKTYWIMIKCEIICLLGNDGCGKSSICELINSKKDLSGNTIVAIERSNGLGVKYEIDPSIVDKLTLEYTFDHDHFNKTTLPNQTVDGQLIYWIILDCDVDTILKRIQSRTKQDIWETRKALGYFQQRFRQLSAHFGLPYIDTSQRTLEQVCDEILNIVIKYPEYYRQYRQLGTQTLNYDSFQQYDVENKLYEMVNTFDFDKVTDLPEYAAEFNDIDKRKLYIKWYVNNSPLKLDEKQNIVKIGDYEIPATETLLKLVTEGESKKVYQDISGNPYTKNLAFIILKSTIYSHTMQATAEISNLSKILYLSTN